MADLPLGAPQLRAARPARRRRRWTGWGFVAPFLVVFAFALVAPIGYAIYKLISKEAAGQRTLSNVQVQADIRQRLRDGHAQLLRTATLLIVIWAPPVAFSMTMDHPFLWAVRDDQSGELLFIGVLEDPS